MPGEVSEVVRTLAKGEQRPAGRCPSERERRGRFKGRRDRCRMDAQRGRVAPDGLLPTVFARAHRAQTLDQDLVLVKLEHDVRQPPALLALERVAVGGRLVAAWPERGGEERRGEGGRVLLEGLGDGWWEADWVGGEGGTSAERGGKAGEQAGGVSSRSSRAEKARRLARAPDMRRRAHCQKLEPEPHEGQRPEGVRLEADEA